MSDRDNDGLADWADIDPYRRKSIPESVRISPQWINENPQHQEQVRRRRARAQAKVVRATAYAYGNDAASQLTFLLDKYPSMSPGAMTGLVYGQQFIPKGQRNLPDDKREVYAPIREAFNLGEVAFADVKVRGEAQTLLPNEQDRALDKPPGLLGKAFSAFMPFTKLLQFGSTGFMTSFGYPMQSYVNLARQYYGDIDYALDLQKQANLTDDELRDIVGDEMFARAKNREGFNVESLMFGDLDNALGQMGDELGQVAAIAGSVTLPGMNIAAQTLFGQGDVARNEEFRTDGMTVEGSKSYRKGWAQEQWGARVKGTFNRDQLWRRTALGEWWNSSASANSPLEKYTELADGWLGVGEYMQVDSMERGLVDGFAPTYNLYTERQKRDQFERLQRRLRESDQRNVQLSAEELIGLTSARPWTWGKGAMMNIDTDPESAAQKYGSGFIDAAIALADPSGIIPIGKVGTAAKVAMLTRLAPEGKTATIAAMRRAMNNPEMVDVPVAGMSDVAEHLAEQRMLSPEAARAAKVYIRAKNDFQQQVHNQRVRMGVDRELEFDDQGNAWVVGRDNEFREQTSGVRTATDGGYRVVFRDRKGADRAVEVVAKTNKAGEITGYRVTDGAPDADNPRTFRKTFATQEEADDFAKRVYLSNAEDVDTAVQKGLKKATDTGPEAYLADLLTKVRARRARTLRVAATNGPRNSRRWNIVDDSLEPFTEVSIRAVDTKGEAVEAAVGGVRHRVVTRADGKAVVYEVTKDGNNGRRLHVADTADDARQWSASQLHPLPSGRRSDLTFAKASDGVWEAPGYSIMHDVDDYGDDVYKLTTFDGQEVSLPSLREAQTEARTHAAQTSGTFAQEGFKAGKRQPAPFYGVYDGDTLISSHETLGEASKAAKREALNANARIEQQVQDALNGAQGQSAIREGVSVVDDQGNRITVPLDQDAEARLLEEFDLIDGNNTARLADAYEHAEAKLSTETFLSNEAFWQTMDTVWGQRLLNILVNATSVDKIMRMIPGMKIADARALAAASDEDSVKALLGQMVGPRLDPGQFAATTGLRRAVIQTKYKLGNNKYLNPLMYRPFLYAPSGRVVDATDADEVYWEARRFGEGIGVSPAGMEDVLNAISEADTPVARYEAFYGDNGFLETTVREHLKKKGVNPDEINEVISVFKGAENLGQLKRKARQVEKNRPGTITGDPAAAVDPTVDDIMRDNYAGPLIVGRTPEEVLFTDELLSNGLPLPDYREIKRILSPLGRAETKLFKGTTATRAVGDVLGKLTSIWRNWTLISAARAVRDTIDMQVRVALAGGPSMLNNPATFIGSLLVASMLRESSTRTRAVMANIPLLGAPALLKFMNRRLPHMDQQLYQDSFLVSTDSARVLLDPAQANATYDDAAEWQGMRGKYARNQDVTLDRDGMNLSVSRDGVVEPIEVVFDSNNGLYKIVNGGKRLQAAVDTGTTHVPMRIRHGSVAPDSGHTVARADEDAPWHTWKAVTGSEEGFVGGVEEVVKRARRAVAKDRHWTVGVWALSPLLDKEWASVNGKAWYDDLNRMLSGEQVSMEDMNKLARQTSTAMGNWQTDENLTRGVGTVVEEFSGSPKQPKHHKRYAEALADRLGELRLTPFLSRIVDGKMTVEQAVDRIMRSPKLRANYNAMYKSTTGRAGNQGNLSDTLRALKEEDGTLGKYIEEQYKVAIAAVGLFTGKSNYQELTDAFITGRFAGAGLSSQNKALTKFIRSVIKQDHALPQTVEGVSQGKMGWLKTRADQIFSAQGEVYDLYSMHPMQRKLYVDEVARLIKYARPEERQKMLRSVWKRGDKALTRRISEEASKARDVRGWLDAGHIEALAQSHAADEMKKIFYDAHARQNYALALRVVAPFLQSAVNTVSTWGKLIAKDPRHGYRAFRNVRALLYPESDAISELMGFEPDNDDPYAVGDGFGTVDPKTGQRYFNYPILGGATSGIVNALQGGIPGAGGTPMTMDAVAGIQSLNPWQSGIVPGLNPVMTAPMLAVNPDMPAEDSLWGRIMRLNGVNASDEQNPFLRTLQPVLPIRYSEMFSVGSRKRGETYVNALANEIARGGYDFESDPSAFEDAMGRAEMKTGLISFVEGFMQLAMPTAGSFNMQANVPVGPVGDVTQEDGRITGGANVDAIVKFATLKELSQQYLQYISIMPQRRENIGSAEDFFGYTQAPRSQGGEPKLRFKTGDDYRQGQAAFMKDYGPAALAGVQKIVDSDMKSPWTLEAWDYSQKHPEWWNKYRGVLSGVFKSQDSFKGSIDSRILQMQNVARASGAGDYLTIDDINNAVKAEFADLWQANALQEASAMSGGMIDPSTEYRIKVEAQRYSNGASEAIDFDQLNKDLTVMKDALEDPDAPRSQTSQLILNWLRLRQSNGEYMARMGMSKGDETGNLTSFGSIELWLKGQEFLNADKSGGFASFWARYGSRTFDEKFYATMSGYGG